MLAGEHRAVELAQGDVVFAGREHRMAGGAMGPIVDLAVGQQRAVRERSVRKPRDLDRRALAGPRRAVGEMREQQSFGPRLSGRGPFEQEPQPRLGTGGHDGLEARVGHRPGAQLHEQVVGGVELFAQRGGECLTRPEVVGGREQRATELQPRLSPHPPGRLQLDRGPQRAKPFGNPGVELCLAELEEQLGAERLVDRFAQRPLEIEDGGPGSAGRNRLAGRLAERVDRPIAVAGIGREQMRGDQRSRALAIECQPRRLEVGVRAGGRRQRVVDRGADEWMDEVVRVRRRQDLGFDQDVGGRVHGCRVEA